MSTRSFPHYWRMLMKEIEEKKRGPRGNRKEGGGGGGWRKFREIKKQPEPTNFPHLKLYGGTILTGESGGEKTDPVICWGPTQMFCFFKGTLIEDT